MRKIVFGIILFLFQWSFSQNTPSYEHFKHSSILTKKDTINYYAYSPGEINNTTGILLFIHGSGAFPMFNVTKENQSTSLVSTIPLDLDMLPKNYAFVVVSKKCVPFVMINHEYQPSKCFYENESLDYRVWQYDHVLNDMIKKIKNPRNIITIGHSEGSDVVAKLGTINKKITHIGFWSGSGNSQYNDFALIIRKEVNERKIDEGLASKKLDSLYEQLNDIEKHPNDIHKFWMNNTYKRWHEFSEPAVENLLKISVPIFVAIGTKDEAVPVESSLIIKSEFIRKHKKNLTFKIYPNYDHGFETVPQNANEESQDKWMDVFNEFMNWVEKK